MEKVKEGYKMTELGEIPEEWEVKKIKDLSSFCSNGFVGTASPFYTDDSGGIPYLMSNNVRANKVDERTLVKVKKEFKEQYPRSTIYEGDMLTVQSGHIGTSCIVPKNYNNANCHALIITRFNKQEIIPLFISYYLNSHLGLSRLSNIFVGSTIKHINVKDLVQFFVPVPSLKEQQKISSILSSVDGQIEITGNLIEKTKELKKGLMQKLLTKGIGHERFKDTEIGKIPVEWEVYSLKDLGETYTGLSGKAKDDFGKGKPYIPYKNIFKNTKIDIKYLDYVEVGSNENQSLVQYGDVFFTTSSETPEEVGMSSVLLDKVEDELYLNSFCFGYRLNDLDVLSPNFARYLLRGNYIRKIMGKLAQGSTRFNLSKNAVLEMKVSVPPLQEQQKIASILSSIDEKIEEYQSKKEKLEELKKGLMQKLLSGMVRVKI